ncbi:hypothetical protein BRETT_002430 [Brettanomyces bruxellensis]|uniref:Uncharacterized protein n=1 Tax=Dekkera bruxellensis TaxID=5007 RepID=A0A871R671_DEKBR|nr:uncharacterized protein BRETT_002430 [Brettanomyces bruxellensis]QOU22257.1 hypothetical protein BRETT_002430 [Brettanomyces bruxellensis]
MSIYNIDELPTSAKTGTNTGKDALSSKIMLMGTCIKPILSIKVSSSIPTPGIYMLSSIIIDSSLQHPDPSHRHELNTNAATNRVFGKVSNNTDYGTRQTF